METESELADRESPSERKENSPGNSKKDGNLEKEKFREPSEVEDDDSNQGVTLKVTAEMIAEEEELQKQRKLEAEEEEREAKKKLDEEETEKRLKRLAVLLNQSEFFSNFIAQRIEEQKAELHNMQEGSPTNKPGRKKGKSKSAREKQLLNDKALLDARVQESPESGSSQAGSSQSSSGGTKITPMGIEVSTRQPFLLEGACMRDYQLDGFDWLKLLYLNGVNGILADEMGLGKTIQTIALICFMIENKLKGPYLIVAPLSTLPNWMNEFSAFCPRLPTVMYHGTMDERIVLSKQLNKTHSVECDGFEVKSLPVVITSYEIAMRDKSMLQNRHWEMVVIDEGHRIKNHQCRLGREMRLFKSKCRLLLTGTPLQNDLRELWSLLNYLIPDVFADLTAFESWFEVKDLSAESGGFEESNRKIVEREKKNQVLGKLHKILQPFMLRRMKCDVDLNLPPKKEILVFTPMTPVQTDLYKHILHRTIHDKVIKDKEKKEKAENLKKYVQKLDEQGPVSKRLRHSGTPVSYDMDRLNDKEFERRYNANLESHNLVKTDSKSTFLKNCVQQGLITSLNPCSIMVDLRKVVNHPYLIQMPLIPGTLEPLIDENIINCAGKMLVLDAMLAKLKQKGHKVLIFSQWRSVLDFLEEFMLMREYNYCRLDGCTKVMDRVASIAQFNKDPKIFAFLLSTRAGGLGINLTAADTVIIYDSDWNPQCDLQAQDRCHRIGQTRPVVVYRLTTDGTIDRRMVERATGKRRLEKLIIKQGHFVGQQKKMTRLDNSGEFSAEELLKLLNSKDYSREVQSNGFVFSDEELEQLLDRSDMLKGKVESPPKPLKRKHPESNTKPLFEVI